ncbi:MAG: hypothetical protein H7330_01710 [Hymenobacteraceae bacterium]|nr:hypothetical protein [Hymenobacteraceae bacterium]
MTNSLLRWLIFALLGVLATPSPTRAQSAPPPPEAAWQLPLAHPTLNGSVQASSATDGAGNVYVCGSFDGTVSFGPHKLSSTVRKGKYGLFWNDGFVAKRSAAGQWEWATRLGARGNRFRVAITQVVATPRGEVVVAGTYGDTLTFAGTTTTVYAPGGYGMFVAHLSAAGAWGQVTAATAAYFAYPTSTEPEEDPPLVKCTSMVLDARGTVYLAGVHKIGFQLGSLTLPAPAIARAEDGFVVALGANGSWQWVQKLPGANEAVRLAVAPNEGVVVAGQYYGSTLQLGRFTVVNLKPINYSFSSERNLTDVFIARLSPTGQ